MRRSLLAAAVVLGTVGIVGCQTAAVPSSTSSAASAPAAATPSAVTALPIAPGAQPVSTDINDVLALAWLEGCWAGNVNQRSFREQWTAVRGNMLLGVGSTVYQGKVQDYQYLRIEAQPDGVFYVALPSGQAGARFKLTAITPDQQATLYTFSNPANDFPQEIVYRRGGEGWLYATIQGKLRGEPRKAVFPMRRVDCESGDFIRQ